VGGPPFCYTLCGQRCQPPVRHHHEIRECPNGLPVCPECTLIGDKHGD
jgi:hypothetical protein